jgi:hypothetical protein
MNRIKKETECERKREERREGEKGVGRDRKRQTQSIRER